MRAHILQQEQHVVKPETVDPNAVVPLNLTNPNATFTPDANIMKKVNQDIANTNKTNTANTYVPPSLHTANANTTAVNTYTPEVNVTGAVTHEDDMNDLVSTHSNKKKSTFKDATKDAVNKMVQGNKLLALSNISGKYGNKRKY